MITFTRLRSGAWGLRGSAAVLVPGATVTVTKRNGEEQTATVGEVVWAGEGVAIAKIAQAAPARTAMAAHVERNDLIRQERRLAERPASPPQRARKAQAAPQATPGQGAFVAPTASQLQELPGTTWEDIFKNG